VLHVNAPVNSLYVPASHVLHSTLSDEAVYPTLQTHLVLDVFASPEIVVSGHVIQMPVPIPALYVPIPHALHAKPSAPVYPARHVQSAALPLPDNEKVLAGHPRHVLILVALSVVLYVPARHLVHVSAPAALYVPARQRVHALISVAPNLVLYVPARHFVHVSAPVALLHVPAGQLVHVPAPTPLYIPATQLIHVPTPVAVLFVPAVQLVQGFMPSALYVPGRQLNLQSPVEVSSRTVPAAHTCSYAVGVGIIGATGVL
jgi:hypothetical protein